MPVRVLLGLAAVFSLVLTPLAVTAATAAPNPHWGQSPYYPNCLEGPCRVVLIADKTGDSAFAAQLKRWAGWMNYVRVNFDLKLPAFGYVGPAEGIQPDPGCATAPGVISFCKSDAIVNADCNTSDPVIIRCSKFTVVTDVGHIQAVRSSVRPRQYSPPDVWTVVCSQLGLAIGMPSTSNTSSCLNSSITLGGSEKYYVNEDWQALVDLYNHPAID
jgi:hypothetical protein